MDSTRTVSVIAPASGRKNFVALNVPIKNLATYSLVAKHHFFPGAGSRDPVGSGRRRSLSNRTEFDLGEGIHEEHARTIAAFIKASDPANPKLITLTLFGNDLSVEELVGVWRVIGHGFKVPRELQDESIRDDLRRKMYEITPYTSEKFKLIGENLDFDRGLVHSAMDRVAFLHIKGYLDDKTKQEVEKYCKSREGFWDSLLETVGRVESKINEAASQKATREQQQSKSNSRNKSDTKSTASLKNKENSTTTKNTRPCEGPRGGEKSGGGKTGGGKSKGGKGKAKQVAKPFVRKDTDFPPLS